MPPTLFGRDNELDRLRGYVQSAQSGEGSLVLLAGEAGIGKTALGTIICQEARQAGALVLAGSSYDLTTPPPYGPWIEIFKAYPGGDDLPSLPEQLRADSGMSGLDNQATLFDLIGRFLSRVAGNCPVVLLLEDIHWTDPGSLDLLRYLARTLPNHPVLLIATYRDDEIIREHDLFTMLPALVREGRSHRLVLRRLESQDVLALIHERYRLNSGDERRLVDYLQRLAEGNPLFTTELLYMLEEQRLLISTAGGWQLGDLTDVRVPALVHQVIERRLTALHPAARIVLDLAAIAGYETPLVLIQDLYHGTVSELDVVLQQALDHRLLLLQPDQRSVRFSHALVRQAVYAAIPPLRRQSLHRQAGELLAERSRPDADVVANHFFLAGDERAVDWLVRAAEQAQTLFAPQTVITRCEQAIYHSQHLGVEPPLAAYRLRGLARETIGDFDGAREDHELALKLAREQAVQQAEWQALLDLGALWASRDYASAKGHLEQALDLAREIGDPAVLGQSLNRLGNWYANAEQFNSAFELHGEALEIFERLNDRPGIAATLDLLGMAYGIAGETDRGAEVYERAIPLLRELDERQLLVTALVMRSGMRFGGFDTGQGVLTSSMYDQKPATAIERTQDMEEAIQIVRDIGWRAGEALCLAMSGRAAELFGEFDRAMQHGQEALRIASDLEHQQWMTLASTLLGGVCLDLFAFDQALVHLQRASELAVISRFWTVTATECLAAGHIARGEFERADMLLRPLIDMRGPIAGMGQHTAWYLLAELELARDSIEDASDALERLETSIPGTLDQRAPHLLHLQGRIRVAERRYPEAETALRQAQETAEAFGYRPILWQILGTLRGLYLEQGRPDEAAKARTAAVHIIDELAANVDDAVMREHFVTTARAQLPEAPFSSERASPAIAGLTPREIEVLRLVGRGMTNVEVGGELFISPRTVGQHLSSIFSKLEVSNRTEAARVATELGLL